MIAEEDVEMGLEKSVECAFQAARRILGRDRNPIVRI